MPPVINHALQMQAKPILKFPRSEVVFEGQGTMPQKGTSDCRLFAKFV